MENGSNVSDMLHDEINIMFIDWSVTKEMVIKGTHSSLYFFDCMIIFFIYPYIVLQIYIFQHIQIDLVCVIITEMDEYTGTQQEEEEMDIPNISTHELIPVQEDEDINNFITELFNENNTLPKCELDQWLEDYLEEMELHNQQQQQQQQQGEQSQEQSLLDMCEYSDISSVEEEENSPSSGQCKEIMMKTMLMNKIIMEIIYTIFVIVYFVVEVLSMEENKEEEEEILIQKL